MARIKLAVAPCAALIAVTASAQNSPTPCSGAANAKRNIVVIWGDGIGQTGISAYSKGLVGYQTPDTDRIAKEGP